jgi:hypothetical protein
MDVSAFRFAIETLEKDKDTWSVLCLMADDLEAARMAWTLVEMLPGDGVRIALIDPSLKDKPERILWEHLKDAEPDRPFELTPVPDPIFEIDDRDEEDAPRTFRLGSELELAEPPAIVRPKFLDQPPAPVEFTPSRRTSAKASAGSNPASAGGLWPPSRSTVAKAGAAAAALAGIAAAVLWSLPEHVVPMAEQPVPPPVVQAARLAAPAAPAAPPTIPAPVPPPPADATPKEAAGLFGKWSKDAASCATEYLLYQPDRSYLFDARTSLASGGTVYYGMVDDDLIAFDGSTEARYSRLGPDKIQQVSYFSTRTGPHPGGPALVRCPDVDPPDRVDWTPASADRATAMALIAEARAQFEAAQASAGTTETPDPLRGRWGAKCDLGYIEWTDGLQTSWSTFGGTEKRTITQYKQLGTRFTIVFEGGYTQFYDIVGNDQIVLSGVGAQGALTDSSPPAWIARRCPL